MKVKKCDKCFRPLKWVNNSRLCDDCEDQELLNEEMSKLSKELND